MSSCKCKICRCFTGRVLPALVLLLFACGDSSSSESSKQLQPAHSDRPNIVIVTLDTTRADHLGAYGYFRDTSPALDAFVGDSIVFERVLMPMATTLPTHLSLFTSTHPLEHGVLANTTQGGERFVPSPRLRSFAAAAADLGYHTAAFVSAAPLKRGSGIEHGFETFGEPRGKHRDASETTRAALSWLAGLGDQRPFLLWVHYYDAHYPFEAPQRVTALFRTDTELERYLAKRRFSPTAPRPLVPGVVEEARRAVNGYDAELRFQDLHLGKLLARLRSLSDWDSTVVAVLGDHGEGLCQHGEAAHGGVWDEQLHVPFLLRVGGERARRVATPLSAQDVLPTLLGRIEAKGFESFLAGSSGRDVLSDAGERPILSQDTGRKLGLGPFERDDYRYALSHRGFKYIRIDRRAGNTDELLFHLAIDPFELHDIASRQPELLAEMRATLESEIARYQARGLALRGGELETAPADPELVSELCALGYLACPDQQSSDSSAASD